MTVALSIAIPAPIYDYTSLVAAVQDQLDRDDLADKLPRFIQLTESVLKRRLRTLDMEQTTLLVATSETVDLPSDFVAMRSIYIEANPDRPLRAMAPGAIAHEFAGSSGIPVAYVKIADTLKLAPPPAAETTLEMVYLARFEHLSEAVPQNWIITDHPDLYFYGCLMHAEAFVDNPERVALWKGAFDEALNELVRARARDRWGAGPLVPNTVRQVRGARC